jgi:transcriptional regulator with XRE-family HTH domain
VIGSCDLTKPLLGLSYFGVRKSSAEDSMRNPEYQKLLSILVEQRARVSMTQADVARALKKPQSFVSKYERGERRLDFAETITLCRILGIDPNLLLSEFTKRKRGANV